MTILSYKKFAFKGPSPGIIFETKGGGIIEEAPDWIKNTWLYDMAVKDKAIIVVEGSAGSAAKAVEAAEEAKNEEAKTAEAVEETKTSKGKRGKAADAETTE